MPLNPDPRLVAAIRRQPEHLRVPLLTTALIESGGRLDAVGDGGRSHGPYQMYDLGRGAGVPISKRRDPMFSTQAAVREFQTFWSRGARGGDLAYRAQRPADRGGYLSRYAQYAPEAKRILGMPATPAERPATRAAGSRATGGGGELTPESAAVVSDYLRRSEADVMAGREPQDVTPVLAAIRRQTGRTPESGGERGHHVHDGHDHSGEGVPLSGPVGGFSRGGGPEAHATRALGNWQSDNAYDIMGKAGQPVYSPISGRVVKISGQPGGDPGFAGYGITVRTGQGDLFFKHLGSTPLRVGSAIRPGALIGTLDAATAGGPHLHLGGQNRSFLDRLYARYVG